jgi:hypothetical protein
MSSASCLQWLYASVLLCSAIACTPVVGSSKAELVPVFSLPTGWLPLALGEAGSDLLAVSRDATVVPSIILTRLHNGVVTHQTIEGTDFSDFASGNYATAHTSNGIRFSSSNVYFLGLLRIAAVPIGGGQARILQTHQPGFPTAIAVVNDELFACYKLPTEPSVEFGRYIDDKWEPITQVSDGTSADCESITSDSGNVYFATQKKVRKWMRGDKNQVLEVFEWSNQPSQLKVMGISRIVTSGASLFIYADAVISVNLTDSDPKGAWIIESPPHGYSQFFDDFVGDGDSLIGMSSSTLEILAPAKSPVVFAQAPKSFFFTGLRTIGAKTFVAATNEIVAETQSTVFEVAIPP